MSGDVMKRKVVTLCGSMRFSDKIAEVAERLELENGHVVLTPVLHVLDKPITASDADLLGELHLAKIDISDAIYVVNVGGYVGEAVTKEIEYAQKRGKEIIYLE